jgi:hypothetical protein
MNQLRQWKCFKARDFAGTLLAGVFRLGLDVTGNVRRVAWFSMALMDFRPIPQPCPSSGRGLVG